MFFICLGVFFQHNVNLTGTRSKMLCRLFWKTICDSFQCVLWTINTFHLRNRLYLVVNVYDRCDFIGYCEYKTSKGLPGICLSQLWNHFSFIRFMVFVCFLNPHYFPFYEKLLIFYGLFNFCAHVVLSKCISSLNSV